jgi:hypothetical protein
MRAGDSYVVADQTTAARIVRAAEARIACFMEACDTVPSGTPLSAGKAVERPQMSSCTTQSLLKVPDYCNGTPIHSRAE